MCVCVCVDRQEGVGGRAGVEMVVPPICCKDNNFLLYISPPFLHIHNQDDPLLTFIVIPYCVDFPPVYYTTLEFPHLKLKFPLSLLTGLVATLDN